MAVKSTRLQELEVLKQKLGSFNKACIECGKPSHWDMTYGEWAVDTFGRGPVCYDHAE